jgi:hypothetical protein
MGRRALRYSGRACTASPTPRNVEKTEKPGEIIDDESRAARGALEVTNIGKVRRHQIIALWAYLSYPVTIFGVMMRPMTSSEMDKLAGLYSELDFRLEQGEAESPEIDRLFQEVSELLNAGADVWFHFDPAGMAQIVVHLVPEHRGADVRSATDN